MKKIRVYLKKHGVNMILTFAVVSLILVIFLNQKSASINNENIKKVTHTLEVKLNIKSLESKLYKIKSDFTLFLKTNNDLYYSQAVVGVQEWNTQYTSLKDKIKDNKVHQERLERINDEVIKWVNFYINKNAVSDEMNEMISLDEFSSQISSIISSLEIIEREESNLLEARNSKLQNEGLLSRVIFFTLSLLILFSLFTSFKVIKDQNMQKDKLFENIEEKTKFHLFNSGKKMDDKDGELIVSELISNLQNASFFIQEIEKGNYNVEYKGINSENLPLNQGNLTGALIHMRDEMQQVAVEEKQRNWATAGMAQFAEILRKSNNDLQELSDEIIRNIIQYVDANQGAIYVLEENHEEEKVLRMKSCYAYNKKKYINIEIAIGQGLIGQAYLEREYILLTDVPQDYIKITSGLGESNPNCVLILPLIINDEVHGILEIASFKVFKDYEIEFLNRLSESIASTISVVKTNETTKKLLRESQEMTEMMRAQEEEMRQNMEELQATQEALLRQQEEDNLDLKDISIR